MLDTANGALSEVPTTEEVDYYKVGSPESPVVSDSSLSALNPDEGGSIQRFLGFFKEAKEEKKSLSLSNGKLLHRYMQHESSFAVSSIEKPSAMLGDLCDDLFLAIDKVQTFPDAFKDVDVVISSTLKTDNGRSAQIHETRDAYTQLSEKLAVQVDDLIAVLRYARVKGSYYTSYTDESKIVNKVLSEGVDYLKFRKNTKGKIILDHKQKVAIEGAVASLNTNRKICELLHLNNSMSLEGVNEVLFHEVPIYWQEKVPVMGMDAYTLRVNCKGRLDLVIVDLQAKVIKLIDLKTTGKGLYRYFDSFLEYRTYRQLAYYVRALARWFTAVFPDHSVDKFDLKVHIPVVETNGQFLSGIYNVSLPWIEVGKDEYKSLLSRYAWHNHTKITNMSYEESINNGIMEFPEKAKGS